MSAWVKTIAVLLISSALCSPAKPMGVLSFLLIERAFSDLGSRAAGALFFNTAPQEPPSWGASLGAAELLNDKLPMETSDGFTFLAARAPAPGALEITLVANALPAPSGAEIDKAWGPGLISMFCGSSPTLWSRWVAIGGVFGVEVLSPDGTLIRRYGAARSDCQRLALRRQGASNP